jgi:hypothetical protein
MHKGNCGVILGMLLGSAAHATGCDTTYADYYKPLTEPTAGTAGTGTGGTGGMKPDCSGIPSTKNTIDECGVFAQADATGTAEDGTQAHPYKTLQKAIDNAGEKRVYACASAPFAEAATIAAGVELYGGFDCAKGWAWAPDKRSTLNGPADAVALTIEKGADGAKVEGFTITGASPSDMKGGRSSIAVAVDDVAADLVRCDVTASDAADGLDGQMPSGLAAKGADAALPDPTTMNACINPAAVTGGAPGMTSCDDGTTAGGLGGKGGITGTGSGDGQKGADGSPMDVTNGIGGAGESAAKCAPGIAGKDGDVGVAGAGGAALGALALSGIVTSENTDGESGTKAQGGGGGGGARSGTFCIAGAMTVDGPGASGGGGGAGGCGGKGGGGGKAGGSSIAIVSLGTKLTLTEVTLGVGKGGKGGAGTSGQGGGALGLGALGGAASGTPPSKAGCQGGNGGVGGDGGPGGGGRGGHAIGLAYAKTPTAAPMIKTFTAGSPGGGGTAGNGAPMSSNGSTGATGACWDFGAGAACE